MRPRLEILKALLAPEGSIWISIDDDEVHYFDNAAKALGIIFMRFDQEESMKNLLENINSHICVKLCGGV